MFCPNHPLFLIALSLLAVIVALTWGLVGWLWRRVTIVPEGPRRPDAPSPPPYPYAVCTERVGGDESPSTWCRPAGRI